MSLTAGFVLKSTLLVVNDEKCEETPVELKQCYTRVFCPVLVLLHLKDSCVFVRGVKSKPCFLWAALTRPPPAGSGLGLR